MRVSIGKAYKILSIGEFISKHLKHEKALHIKDLPGKPREITLPPDIMLCIENMISPSLQNSKQVTLTFKNVSPKKYDMKLRKRK